MKIENICETTFQLRYADHKKLFNHRNSKSDARCYIKNAQFTQSPQKIAKILNNYLKIWPVQINGPN